MHLIQRPGRRTQWSTPLWHLHYAISTLLRSLVEYGYFVANANDFATVSLANPSDNHECVVMVKRVLVSPLGELLFSVFDKLRSELRDWLTSIRITLRNDTPTAWLDILPALKGEDSQPPLGYCGLRRVLLSRCKAAAL